MSRQILNTGGSANDGSGDTLRIASEKINSNFNELYQIAAIGGGDGGVTLEFISNYVDSAISGALDGVDPQGVITNAAEITSLDAFLPGL